MYILYNIAVFQIHSGIFYGSGHVGQHKKEYCIYVYVLCPKLIYTRAAQKIRSITDGIGSASTISGRLICCDAVGVVQQQIRGAIKICLPGCISFLYDSVYYRCGMVLYKLNL
jgi:hypothetical protein